MSSTLVSWFLNVHNWWISCTLQPAGSQVSEGPVIRDVTDLMEDLGETSGPIVADVVTAGQSPGAGEVPAPVMSFRPISPAASNDLDVSPVVASPLNATEAIEPLCLLDPLQDEEGWEYVLVLIV